MKNETDQQGQQDDRRTMGAMQRAGFRFHRIWHSRRLVIPVPLVALLCVLLIIVGMSGGQPARSGATGGGTDPASASAGGETVETNGGEGESDAEIDRQMNEEDRKLFELFEKAAEAANKDPDSEEAKRLQAELEALLDVKAEEARNRAPVAPVRPTVRPPLTQPRTVTAPPAMRTPPPTPTPVPPLPAANPPKTAAPAAPVATPAAVANPQTAGETQEDEKEDPRLADPNAIVIKTDQDIIDLEKLLDIVGKELKLNFLYDTGAIPASKVKLQQYGTIKREHLLDLLEKILGISGYSMVRDDPYIRIVKTAEVIKKTDNFNPLLDPQTQAGDTTVVSQLVEVKYAPVADIKAVLGKFVSDPTIINDIPKTNYLIITDYARRMPRYLEIIGLVDQPGGRRMLEVLTPRYLTAEDTRTMIGAILKELDGELQNDGGSSPAAAAMPRTIPGLPTVPRPEVTGPDGEMVAQPAAPSSPAAAPKGVSMITDKRTNRIYVIGTQRQIEQIRELMALVDIVQPGPDLSIVSLYMTNTEAKHVHDQLSQLLKALHEDAAGSAAPSGTPPSRTPTVPRVTPTVRPPGATPEESGAQPAAGGSPATTGTKGPFLLVDERVNRIILVGSAEQVREVKDLILLLDIPIPGDPIEVEVVKTTYLVSGDAAGLIGDLLKAMNKNDGEGEEASSSGGAPTPTRTGPPAPVRSTVPAVPSGATPAQSGGGGFLKPDEEDGPFLLSDARTNRLFVVGTRVQIEQVLDLLGLLDVAARPKIRLELIDIKHIASEDAASQLGELLEAMASEEVTPQGGAAGGSGRTTAPAMPAIPRTMPATQQPPQSPGSEGGMRTGGSSGFVKPTEQGPFLMADERMGRLFVVGSEEQIAQVRDLLLLLDVELPEGKLELEIVFLKNILPEPAVDQLGQLLEALNQDDPRQDGAAGGRSGATPGRTTAAFPALSAPTRPDGGVGGAQQTPSTQRPATSGGVVRAGGGGLFLLPDNRVNRLLVVGYRKQIDQAKELLTILDIDIELELVPMPVQYVLSGELVPLLANLFSTLKEQDAQAAGGGSTARSMTLPGQQQMGIDSMMGQGGMARRTGASASASRMGSSGVVRISDRGPFLLSDDRTNRVLYVGDRESLTLVTDLMKILDVPPSTIGRLQFRIYKPYFVGAKEVMDILGDLGITESRPGESASGQAGSAPRGPAQNRSGDQLSTAALLNPDQTLLPAGMEEPEVRIAIQESTNRIFIYALQYQLDSIDEILAVIDIDPEDTLGQYEIFALENQTPEFVAKSLQDLLDADKTQESEGGTELVRGAEDAPKIVPLEDIYSIGVRGSIRQRKMIAEIIKVLDRSMPQVLLEATLVQISVDDTFKLGVSLKDSEKLGGNKGASAITPFNVGNISSVSDNGMVTGSGATLAFYNDTFVHATLEALQSQGNARIISKPRILVNNNKEATIKSERETPTTKTTIPAGSDTPIIEFAGYEAAGTTLTITPHISERLKNEPNSSALPDFLRLEITLDVNDFDGEGTANVPPPKTTNNITTDVTIPNGSYIILGGLSKTKEAISTNKVPILGDIPLLGLLFRNVSRGDETSVLYVFVKAEIVNDPDFGSLIKLSKDNRNGLDEMEKTYKNITIVPGIPDQRKNQIESLEKEPRP